MLGVTLGALLGALLPGVYALQLILDRTLGTQGWLEGSLQVSVAGQDALLLETELRPSEGVVGGLELTGEAALREPVFPWNPTGYSGHLWLRLEEVVLGTPGRQADELWSATYTVNSQEAPEQGQPAPCRGELEVLETERNPAVEGALLAIQEALLLDLALSCTHAGPDGHWATGDDVTWDLAGHLELRKGRRSTAEPAL